MGDTLNRPVPFKGTQQERIANRQTHQWGSLDGDNIFCFECEAKPFHVAAEYRCGTRVPREEVKRDDPATLDDILPGVRTALEDSLTINDGECRYCGTRGECNCYENCYENRTSPEST